MEKRKTTKEKRISLFEKFPELEKYRDFIDSKKGFFNDEGDWIRYGDKCKRGKDDEKIIEILIYQGLHDETGSQKRRIDLGKLDKLLEEYSPNPLKSSKNIAMERADEMMGKNEKKSLKDVEKERAEKAQKHINSQESDAEIAEREFGETNEKITKEEKEENIDQKKEEKDEELEKLMAEVERTRKAYAKSDYETNSIFSKLKKTPIGKFITWDPKKSPDTWNCYTRYDTALKNLLEYQAKDIQEKSVAGKLKEAEVDALIKYFNYDEKLNIQKAHIEAKANAWEEKWYGKTANFLLGRGEKFTRKYRELMKKHWGKMLAGGVAISLAGGGIPAPILYIMRGLGGASAGVGFSDYLEARHRKKEEKLSEKAKEEIKKEIKKNPEEIYEKLMFSMRSELDTYQDSFKTEKAKARNRKLMGTTIAILLGTGWAQDALHWGLDKIESSEVIRTAWDSLKEKFGFNVHNPIDHEIIGKTDHSDKLSAEAKTPLSADASAAKIPKIINLEIEEGSSFEGSIIKNLNESGMNLKEAQSKAHLMYLEYIKDHMDPTGKDFNIVHPGAKLEIQFDSQGQPHISCFEDSIKPFSAQDIGEKAAGVVKNAESVQGAVSSNLNHKAIENFGATGMGVVAGMAVAGSLRERGNNGEKDKVINFEKAKKSRRKKQAETAGGGGKVLEMKKAKEAKEERDELLKKYGLESSDDTLTRSFKIAKAVSINIRNNWQIVKDLKYSDLKNISNPELAKNIKKINKDFGNIWGKEAKLNSKNETIKEWVLRISKIPLPEQKAVEQKMAA